MEPFKIDQEMAALLDSFDDGDLVSFAESQDPISDEQIELHIYICFLVFKRSGSVDHLQAAIQQAEGWVAVAPPEELVRARRAEILDRMMAWKSQFKSNSTDNLAE